MMSESGRKSDFSVHWKLIICTIKLISVETGAWAFQKHSLELESGRFLNGVGEGDGVEKSADAGVKEF